MEGGAGGLPERGGGGGEVGEDFEDFEAGAGGFADLAVEIGLRGVEFDGNLRPAPGGHGFEIGGQRGSVYSGADELAGGGDGNRADAYSAVPILLSIRRC